MIAIDTDTDILFELYSERTAAFINDATVTGRLSDATGASTITTFTLSQQVGTPGLYMGTITHDVTATLTEGTTYTVWITAVQGLLKLVKRDVEEAGYE